MFHILSFLPLIVNDYFWLWNKFGDVFPYNVDVYFDIFKTLWKFLWKYETVNIVFL